MDWPTKSCHIQVNWEFHPKAIWAESWHHGDSWENSTFRTCNQTGMSIQDLTVRHSHGTCCSKAHCGKASVILVNIRKFEGNALQHCNHQINQPARSSKIPLNSFTQNAHCKAVKETPWEESPNHHPNLPIFAPCFAAFRRPAASSASWISYTQVQNVANCSQVTSRLFLLKIRDDSGKYKLQGETAINWWWNHEPWEKPWGYQDFRSRKVSGFLRTPGDQWIPSDSPEKSIYKSTTPFISNV